MTFFGMKLDPNNVSMMNTRAKCIAVLSLHETILLGFDHHVKTMDEIKSWFILQAFEEWVVSRGLTSAQPI